MSSEPSGSSDLPQSPPASEPDESPQVTEPPPPPPPPSATPDEDAVEDTTVEDKPSPEEPLQADDDHNVAPTPEHGDDANEPEDEPHEEEARDELTSPVQVSQDKKDPKEPTKVGKGAKGATQGRRAAVSKLPTATGVTPQATAKFPMRKAAPLAAHSSSSRQAAARKLAPSMMRINQQPSSHHQSFLQPPFCRQESFGEGIKTGPSGSDNDSDSEISDAEHFLAKGSFLLTPSHELSLEKASAICEKMNFNAPFSLTKTATGILFKFARPEDYLATFKKGFHKVTGARFYKKIPIPCRPQKTFTVFVLEVPEEVPEEDIRHALYKFHSVVEVVRLAGTGGPQQLTVQKDSSPNSSGGGPTKVDKAIGSTASGSTVELGAAGPPPLIRVTLANLDEYNILLQNGLDFYGATFFPTEAASSSGLVRVPLGPGARKPMGNRILDVVTASGQRVRDLLPVFDAAGFSKIPPPAMKTIKPRPN